jgi:hypothetical protein
MKDILKKLLHIEASNEHKRNITREFLQHLILSIMDKRGHFSNWAFVGGPCLRVVHDLRRFSEDLDFCAISSNKRLLIKEAEVEWGKDLYSWGFKVETGKLKSGKLERCFIRFPGLVSELGISSDPRIKLSIRIEVDQDTPTPFELENTLVQRDILFNVVHHDLPTLFAGKLHAVLFRPFVKGRDIYDLVWYFTKKIPVNFAFLQNAAFKTEDKNLKLASKNDLLNLITEKINAISFNKVKKDLSPFLEDQNELRFITKDTILDNLKYLS